MRPTGPFSETQAPSVRYRSVSKLTLDFGKAQIIYYYEARVGFHLLIFATVLTSLP
jgi:hypothetical protein